MQEGIEKAHGALETFGSLIGVALGVETFREGLKGFAQIDTSILRLGISADKTREEIDKVFKDIDKKAAQSGNSSAALRKSFSDLVSAVGWDEATKAIETVDKAIVTTGASVEDTTEATVKLLNNFKIAPNQIGAVFGALRDVSKTGRLGQEGLVKAIGAMGPEAAELGKEGAQGVREFAGALEEMSKGGANAAEFFGHDANHSQRHFIER